MTALPRHITNVLRSAAAQPSPSRYVLGLLAWRTGWGRWHTFSFRSFRLRLFPSNLSWQMWVNPRQFQRDLDLVSKLLPAGGTMVDVGSNVGHFALEGASAVGLHGRVFAFEPHPRIFAYLLANLRLNPSAKITASRTALSDVHGQLAMENGHRDDMNALVHTPAKGCNHVLVNTLPLDDALPSDLGTINLLKVDVEGAEVQVLRGASRCLDRTEAILVEAGDLNTQRFGTRAGELLALLRQHDFHVRTITGPECNHEPRPEDFTNHVGNWLAMKDEARLHDALEENTTDSLYPVPP